MGSKRDKPHFTEVFAFSKRDIRSICHAWKSGFRLVYTGVVTLGRLAETPLKKGSGRPRRRVCYESAWFWKEAFEGFVEVGEAVTFEAVISVADGFGADAQLAEAATEPSFIDGAVFVCRFPLHAVDGTEFGHQLPGGDAVDAGGFEYVANVFQEQDSETLGIQAGAC